jgi:hypothetical protein
MRQIMRAVTITILAVASLYEFLVQALGLAWFWGGFSVCERTYLVLPVGALLLGASGLFVTRVGAAAFFSIALGSALAGLGIAGAVERRSKLLCGAPIEVNYSLTFFVIATALALWSGYGLTIALRRRRVAHQ